MMMTSHRVIVRQGVVGQAHRQPTVLTGDRPTSIEASWVGSIRTNNPRTAKLSAKPGKQSTSERHESSHPRRIRSGLIDRELRNHVERRGSRYWISKLRHCGRRSWRRGRDPQWQFQPIEPVRCCALPCWLFLPSLL
jgi:hypothetical protein